MRAFLLVLSLVFQPYLVFSKEITICKIFDNEEEKDETVVKLIEDSGKLLGFNAYYNYPGKGKGVEKILFSDLEDEDGLLLYKVMGHEIFKIFGSNLDRVKGGEFTLRYLHKANILNPKKDKMKFFNFSLKKKKKSWELKDEDGSSFSKLLIEHNKIGVENISVFDDSDLWVEPI